MKQVFSKNWKASKQPRKQRKYLANTPLHLNKKFLSINLSKDLRKKYSTRNIPVRKGDSVKVMRGKFKGKQGKVEQVMPKDSKVIIEGIQIKKKDGSKINFPLRTSNLQIVELNLEDRKRKLGKTKISQPVNTKNKENASKKTENA